LYRRVYRALKSEISAGRLRPRSRLPSTRALALDLGVSRNTVMLAYEQLRGRLSAESSAIGNFGGWRHAAEDLVCARRRFTQQARRALILWTLPDQRSCDAAGGIV